jgi:mono/diheme cytochrome c family protein
MVAMVAAAVLSACGGPEVEESAVAEQDPTPADLNSAKCTTDTWKNYAQGFVLQNCAQCHGNFAKKSVFVKSAAQDMISTGTMPQRATLDPVVKARILKWFACKTP